MTPVVYAPVHFQMRVGLSTGGKTVIYEQSTVAFWIDIHFLVLFCDLMRNKLSLECVCLTSLARELLLFVFWVEIWRVKAFMRRSDVDGRGRSIKRT